MAELTYTYECKVDAKGRVLLPGKLKNELDAVIPEGFIIKRSIFSRCLELWPKQEWDLKLKEVNKLNRFVQKNARFIRKFLAGVKPIDLDNSGRINIPNDLSAFAGIGKNIVITSQINILEIWDKEEYELEVGDSEDFGTLAEEVMGNTSNNQFEE